MRQLTPPALAAFIAALCLTLTLRAQASVTFASTVGTSSTAPVVPASLTVTTDASSGGGSVTTSTYDQASGTFRAYSYPGHSIGFEYIPHPYNYGAEWTLSFGAPYDGPLHPGTYEGARYTSDGTSSRPRLAVDGWYSSGVPAGGSFVVEKVTYGPFGALVSFWATFEQRGGSDGLTYRGEIKYNAEATQASVNQPPAVFAGLDQRINLADPGHLSGGASDDDLPAPAALTTTWSKSNGPGQVTFGDSRALETSATFSEAGEYFLLLTASDGEITQRDEVHVTVVDLAESATIHVEADEGAPLTDGEDLDLNEVDGQIWVISQSGSGKVQVGFSGSEHYFFLDFCAPQGLPLVAGVYENPWRSQDPQPGVPSTYFYPEGPTGTGGRFEIKKIAYGAKGEITSLWVTFEQQAAASAAMVRGEIKFHAGVTDPGHNQGPGVYAGTDARVLLTDALPLAGLSADDGLTSTPFVSTWSVQAGPGTAVFADPHAVQTTARFSTAGFYTLQLRGDDGELQSTSTMHVTVVDAAIETSLDLASEPDAEGLPYSVHVASIEADFTIEEPEGKAIIATVSKPGGGHWRLELAAPGRVPIGVGGYYGARPGASPSRTYLWLYAVGEGLYLDQEGGGFEVLRFVRGDDGAISSLWLVFRTRDGMRGELKYNAGAAGRPARTKPGVSARFEARGRVGVPLQLTGLAVDNFLPVSPLRVSWSSAGGRGTVSFNRPNALATKATFSQAGDYVLKLTATDGVLTGTSLLHVAVTGPNDPTRVRLVFSDLHVKRYDRAGSQITVYRDPYDNRIVVDAKERGGDGYSSLTFQAPNQARLAVGQYQTPAAQLFADGGGVFPFCNAGQFTVRQIAYDADGAVTKLWITFDARIYDGSEIVRGDVRMNADAPNDAGKLLAEAGPDQTFLAGAGTQLQGRVVWSGAASQEPPMVRWEVYGDEGSVATVDAPHSLTPHVRFSKPGVYVAELTLKTYTDISRDRVFLLAKPTAAPPKREFYVGTIGAGGRVAGTMEVRATAGGYYTAKLHYGAKVYAFSGLLGEGERRLPGSSLTCALALEGYPELQVTLKDGASEYIGLIYPDGTGRLGDFPPELAGSYSITADHQNPADGSQALGAIWGVITVTAKGRALTTLHLPDERIVVTSSVLTAAGTTYFAYNVPNGHGIISGTLEFNEQTGRRFLQGELMWTRQGPSLVTTGPLNFTTPLYVRGSELRQLGPNQEPLRLTTGSVPAVLTIYNPGDLYLRVPLTITGRSSTPRGTGDTEAGVAFDDFGLFTGTFIDPATSRTIEFQGIVPGGSERGLGYYYTKGRSGMISLRYDREPKEP